MQSGLDPACPTCFLGRQIDANKHPDDAIVGRRFDPGTSAHLPRFCDAGVATLLWDQRTLALHPHGLAFDIEIPAPSDHRQRKEVSYAQTGILGPGNGAS
jgi:hypothetical protein